MQETDTSKVLQQPDCTALLEVVLSRIREAREEHQRRERQMIAAVLWIMLIGTLTLIATTSVAVTGL